MSPPKPLADKSADQLTDRMKAVFLASLAKLKKKQEDPVSLLTALSDWIEDFRIESAQRLLAQAEVYERYRSKFAVVSNVAEHSWKTWRASGAKEASADVHACRLAFPGRRCRVTTWLAWDVMSFKVPSDDDRDTYAMQADALYAAVLAGEWSILEAIARALEETPAGSSTTNPGSWVTSIGQLIWAVRHERVKSLFDEFGKAIETRPAVRAQVGDDAFTRMPADAAAISWMTSTVPPKALIDSADGIIQVDGESFVPQPDSGGRLVPQSWDVLPRDAQQKPHQTLLPLQWGQESSPASLAVTLIRNATGIIHPMAGKMIPFMFACGSPDGRRTKTPLGTLTALLNPSKKRIQKRDMELVGHVLEKLGEIYVHFPDGTKSQLFNTDSPITPQHSSPSQEVGWRIGGKFAEQLKGKQRGFYLINLTAILKMDLLNPRLFCYAMKLPALWNASKRDRTFDSNIFPTFQLDALAAMAGTLTTGAVEYLKAKNAHTPKNNLRVEVYKTRESLRDDMDALRQYGIISTWEVPGSRDLVRPMPSETYQEAYRRTVKKKDGEKEEDDDAE